MPFGSLTITFPDGRQQQFELARAVVRIGREPDNDVVLADTSVSGYHARLVVDGGRVRVFDAGSRNGTELDGQRVAAGAFVPLHDGSVLQIGRAVLTFHAPLGMSSAGTNGSYGANGSASAPGDALWMAGLTAAQVADAPTQVVLAPEPQMVDLLLRLEPEAAPVTVDQTVIFAVTVINRSRYVDRADLSVEGLPAEWVSVQPASHPLKPGDQAVSQITITPPRQPDSRAGNHTFEVVARSEKRRDARFAVPGTLQIAPYTDYKLDLLDPKARTAWFRGRYDLQLDNRGNHEQAYTLTGQDDEGAFVYRFDAEPVTVRAGARRRVQLRAGLRLMRLFGQPKTYPFNVVGVPLDNSAPMQVVQGRLVQRPPIAPWMLRVLAVLLLLGLIVGCGLLAWPWVPVARAYFFPQPTATIAVPTPAQPTAPLPPTLVPTPNVGATEQTLQGQVQATQGALEVALNQTSTAAGQANVQTQTAVAGNLAQTQTAVTNNLVQTQTAVANAIGQTQTAITSAVNASATAQVLAGQTATASAQQAQTAVAATQTASVVSITQTALAGLTLTPTLTPTALPGSGLDQLIVFNQVSGVPVSGRLPLRGDEYVRQDALFCFYRPLVDSGLGRITPPQEAGAHFAGLHAVMPPEIVAGPPAKARAQQQALELFVQDAIVTEGNDGRGMAVFPLTLNVPDTASVTVTIRYSTRDGTALAGQDYVATENTITLTVNNDPTPSIDFRDALVQQIRVPIIGDTLFEPDETFVLNLELLSNPNDVVLVRSQATGLIVNDDATPTATFTPTFTPTATATPTVTPGAIPSGNLVDCRPPALERSAYQQLQPAIEPPPVRDANNAPYHLFVGSSADGRLVRDSIAVVNFQRNASEATLNMWYPGGEATTYLMFALDERGQMVAFARRDAVDVPAVYQLSVRSIERPIRQVIVEARPNYAGEFGSRYRFAPNVPVLLLRMDFRYTSAPR